MTPRSVVSVGEVMIELVHEDEHLLRLGVAGDTYNTAVHLARAAPSSVAVSYLTALGDDPYSDTARATAAQEGVEILGPRVEGRSIGLYLVRTDDDGERSFTYHRSGSAATTMFDGGWQPVHDEHVTGAHLVHLSAISLQILGPDQRRRLRELLVRARAGGTQVSFDSNLRLSGWHDVDEARGEIEQMRSLCDIALPSLADEQLLTPGCTAADVGETYLAAGAGEVVVKDGAAATHVFHQDRRCSIEPPVVPVVDTTGAGDSFDGAYLAARLDGTDPVDAAREAQSSAAIVIGHRGAIGPRPSPTPATEAPTRRPL